MMMNLKRKLVNGASKHLIPKPKTKPKDERRKLIGEKYYLEEKIDEGAFGEVFLGKLKYFFKVKWTHCLLFWIGTNAETEEKVAIKLESKKTKHPQLHTEARRLQLLNLSTRCNVYNINN